MPGFVQDPEKWKQFLIIGFFTLIVAVYLGEYVGKINVWSKAVFESGYQSLKRIKRQDKSNYVVQTLIASSEIMIFSVVEDCGMFY